MNCTAQAMNEQVRVSQSRNEESMVIAGTLNLSDSIEMTISGSLLENTVAGV